MGERWRWRWLLILTGLWTAWVIARYAPMVDRLAKRRLEELWSYSQEFFLWQVLGFIVLAFVVALARRRWLGRVSMVYLCLSTLALLAVPRDPARFFVVLAFLVWCVLAVGSARLALRRLTDREHATWGLAAAGFYGAMIPAAFLLGIVHGLTVWSVVPLALAVALPGAVHAVRHLKLWQRALTRGLDRLGVVGATSLEAVWIALAVALVWALAPEMFSDSMRSYLPDVQDIARQQGIVAQYLDITRIIPRAFQAMCALGFVVGGYPLAKCLSWLTAGILAAVVCDEVARRSKSIDLGLLAAAVTLACPLLMSLSTSLMFDHAITLLTVASFVALGRGLHYSSRRGVAFSAFLMACVIQIKYNALIFCVVWLACLAIPALSRWGPRGALRLAGPAIVTLAVFGSPWYVYMAVTTGNPIFPYLNQLFESPYWPGSETTLKGLERFRLDDTPWSWILFPWTVTFHTSRIVQRPDGALGFMLLALLPLAAALGGETWRRGRDLVIAGVASIAGICLVTAYARYWLPGYPLLLMALVLGLGRAARRSRWALPRPAAPLLIVLLLGALLLYLPIWNAGLHRFPWQVYTGEIEARTWLFTRFSGLPAVEELNRIVEPDQRVLATDYPAVYTIDADAYEFPSWHTWLHGLEDAAGLRRLLDREAVRYWVVDYSRAEAFLLDSMLATETRLWTDSRLLAAESHVAVYDVSDPPQRPPGFVSVARREIPPLLIPVSRPRQWVTDAAGWRDVFGHRAKRASGVRDGWIEVAEKGTVEYVFTPPPGSLLSRVTLNLRWRQRRQSCVIDLEWLDGDRQVMAQTPGGVRRAMPHQWTHLFSRVPEGARYGRLKVRPWNRQSLMVAATRIDFLAAAESPRAAAP